MDKVSAVVIGAGVIGLPSRAAGQPARVDHFEAAEGNRYRDLVAQQRGIHRPDLVIRPAADGRMCVSGSAP